MDYKKYYNLEEYLFSEINGNFHKHGYLSAEEFFCIVIWKANRKKGEIKARVRQIDSDLAKAVKKITGEIFSKPVSKDRLTYLMKDCGFRLPMATAILTVLYPNEFTVYDVRVCDMLGNFHKLQNRTNPDSVWNGYMEFKDVVTKAVPHEGKLRDKDKWLWGKSFYQDLKDLVEG